MVGWHRRLDGRELGQIWAKPGEVTQDRNWPRSRKNYRASPVKVTGGDYRGDAVRNGVNDFPGWFGAQVWGVGCLYSVCPGLAWCSVVKSLPASAGDQVPSLGQEDPLEEGMAPHSSILWRTPRTEEPGGLQCMGLQRAGLN